jgi:hypothetical protein
LLAAGDRTVTVLNRGKASIARGGAPLRILGATLWTDYAVAGNPAAAAADQEIYVTHHGPHSAARHPGHGLKGLAPAFCSYCNDLVEAASAAGVAAWSNKGLRGRF